MLELDCNKEHIGSFIRNALSLSIVSNIPVSIKNIRVEGEHKGLRKSDLMYITILSQLSNAKTENVILHSTNFTFTPNKLKTNGQLINLKFPALTPLFLPSLMFIFYNTSHKIRIVGPTNRENKITIDFVKRVLLYWLNKIGIKHKLDIVKRGYFQGLGSVILTTREMKDVLPLNITEVEDVDRITAIVYSYGHKEEINRFVLLGAKNRLRQFEYNLNKVDSICLENNEKYKGYGIDLFAEYDDLAVVGGNYTSISKNASQVGKEGTDRLIGVLKKKTPFDKQTANLIIPFLALSKKPSEILIPRKDEYLNIITDLCNKFLGTTFEFEEKENNNFLLKIIPKI